jgi:membrane protein DedA with SNARE-associated domain/rhodanese-related sulfurtransferase
MDTLLTLLQHHGLWVVFLNVLLLQLGLPVPAYPTLVVVGALTVTGPLHPVPVLLVAVLACLVADGVWYRAGQRHGRKVLRVMCRLSLSPDSCVRQTERIYERWGAPSLAVAKFIPGFAAVATSMAGLVRTPLRSFVLFDTLGALLWSGFALLLGRVFHRAIDDALGALAAAGRWGLILLASAVLLSVTVKAVQRYQLIRRLRMTRIGVDELQALLSAGERPLIVDVRSPSSQRGGRIPGALWIDSHAFQASLTAHQLHERTDEEVIVYCACPNEASAAAVAKRLMQAGFARVRPLGGGIEAWTARGFATEASDLEHSAPPP